MTNDYSSLRSPLNNELVGALVVARLVAARRLAPGRHRIAPAGGLAFAATVRMIHWIHRHAAHRRALAQPARTASLANRNVFVLDIAHLSDSCHAIHRDFANLARRQTK